MVAKKDITTLEEHFMKRYGKKGSKKRNSFDATAKEFFIRELLTQNTRKIIFPRFLRFPRA